jgi:hypothetical protein
MTLSISPNANTNYLAKVVKINNLRKHTNADRLQVTTIDGNNIITSLFATEGMLYVYFPLESAINKSYLAYSNAFSDSGMNNDNSIKGYFASTGRVRATRLRGEKSEGYIVPAHDIQTWLSEAYGKTVVISDSDDGTEFDTISDVKLCEKYINKEALLHLKKESNKNNNKKKAKTSRLVDSQFHFHIDTPQLKKMINNLNPSDYIEITRKLHGTSVVLSRVLCLKPLTWYEKLLKRIGINIVDTEYDLVYSSRKVVKNGYLETDTVLHNHYYSHDIWGECAKEYSEMLQDGITLYGEIVGYTKDGAYIQKGYDYGCSPGESQLYVYRATYTSPSGKVYEMSVEQMRKYCETYGIKVVPQLYYGKAKDLYDLPVQDHWHENFLQKLCEDYLERSCDLCDNDVPDEGICLRIDVPLDIDVYKLKSFSFLERETSLLDKGEVDLETQEAESATLETDHQE